MKFDSLIKKILRQEGKRGKINLILIDDSVMRKLNYQFRNKDKSTDVLAFPMNDEGVLGDIAISRETTRRNAKSYGVTYGAELKRLAIHGVLHLLGYDHGKEMRNAEETYKKL